MKKQLRIFTAAGIFALLISNPIMAQTPTWNNIANDAITDPSINKVGIGTTIPPDYKLTVNGDIGFEANPTYYRKIRGVSDQYGLAFYANMEANDGAGLVLCGINHSTDPGSIGLIAGDGGTGTSTAFNIMTYDGGLYTSRLNIRKNGDVGIGITGLPSSKLTVNGDIGYEIGTGLRMLKGGSSQDGLVIVSSTDYNGGGGIHLHSMDGTSEEGAVSLISNYGTGNGAAFKFDKFNGSLLNNLMYIGKDGKVGLGTESPTDKLTMTGNLGFTPTIGTNQFRFITARSLGSGLVLYANSDWEDGSGILMNGNNASSPGGISFIATHHKDPNNQYEPAFSFFTTDGTGQNHWDAPMMVMYKNGRIGIGQDPNGANVVTHVGDYKLFVAGGILTEKLKVATTTGGYWSDFVFADDYKLNSLNDVESYITKNKHLPDVPSASDVAENGYDVTRMDATLLQKIEELTLYIIQQQKEINELKSKLNK